jgi:hypothetical protein
MKNYAESIANLYLRLNGFFLLNNYISHKCESKKAKQHFDSDIIGVKPKYVTEIVGLQNAKSDMHHKLYELIEGIELVGVICEVKGGMSSKWKLTNNSLMPCVKRLGLFDPEKTKPEDIVDTLKKNRIYKSEDNKRMIIKLVASDEVDKERTKSWNHISLSEMLDFIVERLDEYIDKRQSWHFNDSELFQFIIFQNRKKNL